MKRALPTVPILALALAAAGCGLLGGKETQGQASVLHPSSKVGEDRWYPRFTYVVGEGGVAPGGGVRFETPKKMARIPELEEDPKGFVAGDKVSVYTTSETAEVSGEVQDLETSYRWIVRVTGKAPAEAGAEINVNFNDNVVPANAGVYDIPFEIDRKGAGTYEKPETQPAVKIFAAVELVMPSLVTAKEPFTVTANVNPGPEGPPFLGTLKFKASDPGATVPKPYRFTEADKGRKVFEGEFAVALAGNQELRVSDLTGGAMAEKVRFPVRADPSPYNLYWGDTHGHTSLSDGAGTPEDYFHLARYVEDLDFVVLSDHDYLVDDAVWKRIQAYVDRYYEPGAFATLLGFEYSHKLGDRTMILRDTTMPMLRRNESRSDHPAKMLEAYRGKGAIAVPHHPASAFRAADWTFHDPEVQRLTEIYSLHGRSEYYGNLNPITPRTPAGEKYTTRYGVINLRERSVQDALGRGYRLGIIASGDKHDGHPGDLGAVGVYAESLTREAIYDALYRRRVYATTNARAYVDFRADGHLMGEEFTSDAPPKIQATVVGTAPVETLELVKNNRVVFIHDGDDFEESFAYEDRDPRGATSFYYLRVTQQDGEMLWSSPVWLDSPKADATVRFADPPISGAGAGTRIRAEVENKGLAPLPWVEVVARDGDGRELGRARVANLQTRTTRAVEIAVDPPAGQRRTALAVSVPDPAQEADPENNEATAELLYTKRRILAANPEKTAPGGSNYAWDWATPFTSQDEWVRVDVEATARFVDVSGRNPKINDDDLTIVIDGVRYGGKEGVDWRGALTLGERTARSFVKRVAAGEHEIRFEADGKPVVHSIVVSGTGPLPEPEAGDGAAAPAFVAAATDPYTWLNFYFEDGASVWRERLDDRRIKLVVIWSKNYPLTSNIKEEYRWYQGELRLRNCAYAIRPWGFAEESDHLWDDGMGTVSWIGRANHPAGLEIVVDADPRAASYALLDLYNGGSRFPEQTWFGDKRAERFPLAIPLGVPAEGSGADPAKLANEAAAVLGPSLENWDIVRQASYNARHLSETKADLRDVPAVLDNLHRVHDTADREKKSLEAAVADRPDAPKNHYLLGKNLLFKERDAGAALKAFLTAKDLGLSDPSLLVNLGVCYRVIGDLKLAEDYGRRGAEASPQDPRAERELGRTLQAMGEWKEAVERYALAAKLDPDHARGHFLLARAYDRLGLYPQAAEAFRATVAAARPNTSVGNRAERMLREYEAKGQLN